MKRQLEPTIRVALWTLFLACFTFGGPAVARADDTKQKQQERKPAKLKISGAGFWGNHELKKMLRLLDNEEKERETFDANYVEDTALLIISELHRKGYLQADLSVKLTLENGEVEVFEWDDATQLRVSRPLAARRARFRIEHGVRYYFDQIEFEELHSITEQRALRFFVGTDFLLRQKSTRIFTPGRLDQGINSLVEALRRSGFQDAKVEVAGRLTDDESGKVSIRLRVSEGSRFMVRSVRREVFHQDEDEPVETETVNPGVPYSKVWEQDYAQELQRKRYHQGCPDADVEMSVTNREAGDAVTWVDLLAKVRLGPRIRLGAVRFEGNERTQPWLLRRRSRLEPGEWLDRVQVEEGRFRLARLGVFDSVELGYDQTDPETRDVFYSFEEGKVLDVSLLAGYGSYELARGGVEVERRNLFGLAQRARLRGVQSFKSTRADLLYTIPELIGYDFDLFLDGSYLRREEVSFIRLEYGGSAGLQRYFESIRSDASLRYNYQVLSADDAPVGSVAAQEQTTVSAFLLSFKHDRRDNPLYPRNGYKVASEIELASPMFAGEADYVRADIAGSVHLRLGGGRYLHLGLEHGVAVPLSSSSSALPFNKRYFPGGENSVRGYQLGEASPRDAAGQEIGAESFLQGNLELEQALTPSWSVVAFVDGVGLARDIEDYPLVEGLYSAGGGIRWKTIVGPVRLEYGHNLNPRPGDPDGTLHVSIGFPF